MNSATATNAPELKSRKAACKRFTRAYALAMHEKQTGYPQRLRLPHLVSGGVVAATLYAFVSPVWVIAAGAAVTLVARYTLPGKSRLEELFALLNVYRPRDVAAYAALQNNIKQGMRLGHEDVYFDSIFVWMEQEFADIFPPSEDAMISDPPAQIDQFLNREVN